MTAHAMTRPKRRRKAGGFLWLPLALLAALVVSAGSFVSYVLWPTWRGAAIPLDAPALPVTIAGVLFDVPPAAIRVAVQRQPGPHERIDLVFLWPSLEPPRPSDRTASKPVADTAVARENAADAAPPSTNDRVFVTIASLGAVLPPIERLRTIYPRYVETTATAGANGLAVLRFRAGTPYAGEDLVYDAEQPERFFARCTSATRAVPGTCMHERALDGAEITMRFPRDWLDDWRNVAGGFDHLIAQLHPQSR
jgi:hypothetical protein